MASDSEQAAAILAGSLGFLALFAAFYMCCRALQKSNMQRARDRAAKAAAAANQAADAAADQADAVALNIKRPLFRRI